MISGTISMIKLNYENKTYLFFLDNHDSTEYCKNNKIFVHEIFNKIFDDYNLFVEEPVIKNDNLKLVFQTEHIKSYLNYLNTHSFIPFDIRFEFNRKNIENTFYDLLRFLLQEEIKNLEKINIKTKVHKKLLVIFIYHFFKYFVKNVIPPKPSPLIYTHFPFVNANEIVKKLSNEQLLDLLLNSVMEYYLILLLLNSNKKNNIIYLGAAHGIVVTRILIKYYSFQLIKDISLKIDDIFNLENLDNLKSCI